MNKDVKKEIGKFFVDIAKLVFGGGVLSSVLKIQGLSNSGAIIACAVFALLFALFGFLIMNDKEK